MASQQPRLPPPPPPPLKKKSPPATPTTISDLGDDLLREVFLHLPSLPSLVRAALTSPAFLRAVRSSPAFRRRFRELHPPPLLGVFLDIHDPSIPVFAPIRRHSDRDHAAAIRGADVFFTLLPEDDNDPDPQWSMEYCGDGFVVLVNWEIKKMAVYDPLTRSLDLFPVPPDEICCDMYVEFHMLASEENNNGPFHVVSVSHEKWGAQAAVFSSDTREWKVFPFSEDGYSSLNGTLVNGSVYWTFTSGANVRVLNTATLQFSQIEPPLHTEGQEEFKPGETKDGKLCLVCAVQLMLVVWVRRPDNNNGEDRWALDKTFSLQDDTHNISRYCLDDDVSLNVVAIIGGFVYFSTFCERRPNSCHFMCFCLETEELSKLCTVTHSNISYPYIMAFPPSLVCNKVNPQLEGA
ncbi:uncharacterized protein LOC124647703 [Lolium rigidum]|uniref:uncharacterized protein LOC124647703 n=1 Tax=Lolium rigidum TaxID=89674 RepID=UPI001F5DD942|nr:uncharacterized protein LOC124647703 [Lolium rigidum]